MHRLNHLRLTLPVWQICVSVSKTGLRMNPRRTKIFDLPNSVHVINWQLLKKMMHREGNGFAGKSFKPLQTTTTIRLLGKIGNDQHLIIHTG